MGIYARGVVLVAGLLGGLTSCADLEFRAYAGYLQTELSGDVGLASSGSPNVVSADINIGDSLGIDDDGSIYARVEAEVGILRVTVSGFQYQSNGVGTLQADFGNIAAGLTVDTDLKMNVLKGAVTLDLIDWGYVRVSPGVAIDYFDVDLTSRAVGLGVSEDLDIDVPVPMPFVQAEVELGPVGLTVGGGGMKVNYSDVEGTYWDVEGLLRYSPVPYTEVFAGYRWIDVHGGGTADGQDYDTDLTLQGWFVGGGLVF